MKYFMSVYSPSQEDRRVFLMNNDTAVYYYNAYLRKFSHIHIKRCLESGASTVSAGNNRIWGENISDKEIFRRRLIGSVAKETLEVIGH